MAACTASPPPGPCKRKTKRKSCDRPKDIDQNSSLEELVEHYWFNFQDCFAYENAWWGDSSLTWKQALERAWKSRGADGKMHGHQRRIANKLSDGLAVSQTDGKTSSDFSSFEELYNWVHSVSDRVKGLGPLVTYDVARRLGAKLNLEPEIIYLHAGSRIGAGKLGLHTKEKAIAVTSLPKELHRLSAAHIENFLCIYKQYLREDMQE